MLSECLVALQHFREHVLLMAFLLISLHSHTYVWDRAHTELEYQTPEPIYGR